MRLRLLFGIFAVTLASWSASAQNLVINGGFSTDASSWTSFGSILPADGARAWSADDVASNPSSGSALLTASTAGALIGLKQCIAVTAGVTYDTYARIKFPTGQTGGQARAVLELAFFSDASCATSLSLADGEGAVVGTAYALDDVVWPGIPGNAGPGTEVPVVAPVGAASAELRIYVEPLAGASGSHSAKFDQVVLHDASTTPIALITFEAE
ncbi:MAG: hypothetical protein ABIT01_03030 [Thermoanaerobaculia bacterium]